MLYIIHKSWENAVKNLAYEYCLLNEISVSKMDKEILYFWQNRDTVVIGRNQNPYKECNMDYVKENGIELVRRMTGGGAVYHDLGNLNYSFICKEELYDRKKVFEYIVEALNSLGILCQATGRNDITANGVKISGNAFYQFNHAILHHGTIMIDVDINKMESCLTPNKAKLRSKGVLSVHQRVGNLSDIKKDIKALQVKNAIASVFCKYLDCVDNAIDIDEELFLSIVKKFSSPKWIFGNYPPNYETISGMFEWGMIELGFVLKENRIDDCIIETDSLYPEEIHKLELCLKGEQLENIFEYEKQYHKKYKLTKEETVYRDVFCLINEKLIISKE